MDCLPLTYNLLPLLNMITRDDVVYIAKLSRLGIDDSDLDKYISQLQQILQYVEKLNELDTSEVEPTAHVFSLRNVTREDKVKESLPNEEAVNSAPDVENGFFKVPPVIE